MSSLKAERVYHYVKNVLKEVEVVAHSCGVAEPRQLRRHHARVVVEGGRSVRLDELFPPQDNAGRGVALVGSIGDDRAMVSSVCQGGLGGDNRSPPKSYPLFLSNPETAP